LLILCALAVLTPVVSACGRRIAGAESAPTGAESAPTGAESAPTPPPPAAGEVTLSATLAAPATLANGESLPLTFTLTNHGDAGLYVLKWLTPFEGIANEIFRVERDGEILPYEGPLVMRGDPIEEEYLFLAAGASASATVNLATVYDLSEPGAYTIAYTAALQDVAGSQDAMAESIDDLKQIVIPANTISVTLESAISEDLAPEPGPSGEGEAALYVNEDHGFAFRIPATWTLEEAGEQMVMLTHDGLRLAIAFQAPGSDPPQLGGLPAGELETVGTMVFMGEEIDQQAVVYKGKVKVLLCEAQAGDLRFVFQLDDAIAADYEAVDLPESAQSDMAAILASFELLRELVVLRPLR
jgi:hypothetical protein